MPTTPIPSKLCGYDLVFHGPGDVLTYDQLAGRQGACLVDACRYIHLHGAGSAALWGEKFCEEAAKLTGLTRKVDEAKSKTAARTIHETPREYNRRLTANVKLGKIPGVTLESLAALARTVAASCPIDPTPVPARWTPIKSAQEKADELLAGDPNKLEERITSWQEEFPEFYLERDSAARPRAESLARLVELKWRALQDTL